MNIYDEKLQRIEEAEKKVRVAKAKLFEAEKELDETLDLVESELNENLFDDEGDKPKFIIEVLDDKSNKWVHVGYKQQSGKVKKIVYSLDPDSKPKVFPGENAAKGSGIWDQLVADGYVEGKNLRVNNHNK